MRYYFDIHDGSDFVPDDMGIELTDEVAARLQATIALTEIAREILPRDGEHRNLMIRVRTEEGARFDVTLDYALVLSRSHQEAPG